ncbi:MAG: malonyl-CoA decarboxylase [Gammaproteobacteria bacterium]|nr:malonyl-CoA decarboxylase [Gammaproteobacteria bacterium]
MGKTGEAMGTALAREIVQRCEQLSPDERSTFLDLLCNDFAPNHQLVRQCAERYLADQQDLDAFLALSRAIEPPRQELLRRINRAQRGTAILVSLRAHLLALLPERPGLRAVDADFRHLFNAWFNPGFLELRRIDWRSPANVLEKLISYEAVHAIQGWGDLRRRLAQDRGCFAFFHPSLPDEPLIFVEVALVKGMPDSAAPLLSLDSEVIDPRDANTAAFFSINNCQQGLRGISFGNFLIKQVMAELQADRSGLEAFVTLSPLPKFADNLRRLLRGEIAVPTAGIAAVIGDQAPYLCAQTAQSDPGKALLQILEGDWRPHQEQLKTPLCRLALYYLTQMRRGRLPLDPVANFHLANGARLERINPFADTSRERFRDSFGVMVNYLYDPSKIERNHERFIANGTVALSKPLARQVKKIRERLSTRASKGG